MPVNNALYSTLLFLLLNSLPLISGYYLSRIIFKNCLNHELFSQQDIRNSDIVLNIFLIYYAQIVLTTSVLGFSAIFNLENLILANLFVTGIITLFFRIQKINTKCEVGSTKYEIPETNHTSYFRIHIFIIGFFIFLFVISMFMFAVFAPPRPLLDAYIYHLPFPVAWLKTGKIFIQSTPFGDISSAYNPSNGELFYLWLITPFHNDTLVNIGQFIFYIFGGLALYSISRKLGAPSVNSFIPPILFLLTPGIAWQATNPEVDVILCTLFIIALNFLLIYKMGDCAAAENRHACSLHYQNNHGIFLLLSIAIGLFCGVKYLALVYAPLLCLPLFYIMIKNIYAHQPPNLSVSRHEDVPTLQTQDFVSLQSSSLQISKSPITKLPNYQIIKSLNFLISLFMFFFCILFFGGSWYIRNFVETGNPFYPIGIQILGHSVFEGAYLKSALRSFPYNTLNIKEFFPSYNFEFGIVLFFSFVITNLLTIITLYRYNPFRFYQSPNHQITKSSILYVFLLPLFVILLCLFAVPINTQGRFIYPAVSIGYLSFAYLTSSNKSKKFSMFFTLLTICIIALNLFQRGQQMQDIIVGIWQMEMLNLFGLLKESKYIQLQPSLVLAFRFFILAIISGIVIYITRKSRKRFLIAETQRMQRKFFNREDAKNTKFSLLLWIFSTALAVFICAGVFYLQIGKNSERDKLGLCGFNPNKIAYILNWKGKTPLNIAYTGTNVIYALYGQNFKNNIYYINTSGNTDYKLHHFEKICRKKKSCKYTNNKIIDYSRKYKNYSDWTKNLCEKDMDILLIKKMLRIKGSDFPYEAEGFPVENSWAEKEPKIFSKIYDDGISIKIYSIEKALLCYN